MLLPQCGYLRCMGDTDDLGVKRQRPQEAPDDIGRGAPDADISFVARGVGFIVLGSGFLAMNAWLLRQRKEARS